jgi:hypothetical protein
MTRPVWMILIGFVLVLVGGIVMPYLMLPGVAIIPLTKINESIAWLLLFLSYGASVAGLFLGIIGAAMYMRIKRPPQHAADPEKRSSPFSHS